MSKIHKSRDPKNVIVGLDIGTSKIVALVGQVLPSGRLEIIGCGQQESRGLKKGVVVNIEATVESIQQALDAAERMAGYKIKQAYTGVAGSHIRSFNSTGMVAVKDREVSALDVERVLETAKAVNLPTDQQLIHTVPQQFTIDGQEDVREPIGMSGVRLEVKVHIVTGAISNVKNIVKCVRRCGLDVTDLILQPIASADAVLTEDEKELGVIMLDIGAGTTDLAIYFEGAIRHSMIIPISGDQITNDIAMALRTPPAEAEKIKMQHGVAKQTLADAAKTFSVAGLGDRPPRTMTQHELAGVIEPRIEELLALVNSIVSESGYDHMIGAGVVITGGSALIPGVLELAAEIFNRPARLGLPDYQGGHEATVRNPRYSTAVGLLKEALAQHVRGPLVHKHSGVMGSFGRRAKEWFLNNF